MILIHLGTGARKTRQTKILQKQHEKEEIAQHSEKSPPCRGVSEAREDEERAARGLARGSARIHGLPQVYEDMRWCQKKDLCVTSASTHLILAPPTNLREGPCTVADNPIALEKEVEGQ